MHKLPVIALSLMLAITAIMACDGGGSAAPPLPPQAPSVNVDAGLKQLIFSWAEVPDATHYRLLENPDGHSGFTQVGPDIPSGTLSVTLNISVHLHDFVNALYFVQACNSIGCAGSTEITAMNIMLGTIGYFKASNTGDGDLFGWAVALSADGNTLAVGALIEDSNATGVDGDQHDNSTSASGAVYIFRFDGTDWSQQAYVKPSNTGLGDQFGIDIALSADGNTLAVGAFTEDSNATGVGSDQNDNSAVNSGAVYLFRFDGTDWHQQAYIKASNTDGLRCTIPEPVCPDIGDSVPGDWFGRSVALSADGNLLAVGAQNEGSNATGINGDQNDNSIPGAGAVYVFRFDGTDWFQQAYIKPPSVARPQLFGYAVALSADGNTLAVGPLGGEVVFLFRFDGTAWLQQSEIKTSAGGPDQFGNAVALSADGNTLAVGALGEDSNATGINGDPNNSDALNSGAAYIFRFDGTDWFQQAYIKASNTGVNDFFGEAVALSADSNTLAVGTSTEDSNATGINGDQNNDSARDSGAVYVFRFDGTDWSQQAYVKASNTGVDDHFGDAIAVSADGNTLAVGAKGEDSNAIGIGGDQNDNSGRVPGAVYLY